MQLYAEYTAYADSSVDLSLSRSILRASDESRECNKWQKTGRDQGSSNKIADQW